MPLAAAPICAVAGLCRHPTPQSPPPTPPFPLNSSAMHRRTIAAAVSRRRARDTDAPHQAARPRGAATAPAATPGVAIRPPAPPAATPDMATHPSAPLAAPPGHGGGCHRRGTRPPLWPVARAPFSPPPPLPRYTRRGHCLDVMSRLASSPTWVLDRSLCRDTTRPVSFPPPRSHARHKQCTNQTPLLSTAVTSVRQWRRAFRQTWMFPIRLAAPAGGARRRPSPPTWPSTHSRRRPPPPTWPC